MKFLDAKILIPVFTIGARAIPTTSTLRQFLMDNSTSIQQVSSTTLTVDGHDISLRRFTYLDGNATSAALTPDIPSRHFNTRQLVKARSAVECTTPSPECQCGATINRCGCVEVSAIPLFDDCNTLLSMIPVIVSSDGPTFIVPPTSSMEITFRTCAFAFSNGESTDTEYCWDDMIALENQLKTCVADSSIGICVPDDERFVVALGHSG
ncbi:hypothetical protein ACEPAH_2063 [Sanghuangporus vaninii]